MNRFINRHPDRTLAPSKLRLLLAILQMHQWKEHITVRALSKRLGWASPNYTAILLRQLRKLGLIDYSDFSAATIRPKCQLDFYLEHLGDEKKYPGTATGVESSRIQA